MAAVSVKMCRGEFCGTSDLRCFIPWTGKLRLCGLGVGCESQVITVMRHRDLATNTKVRARMGSRRGHLEGEKWPGSPAKLRGLPGGRWVQSWRMLSKWPWRGVKRPGLRGTRHCRQAVGEPSQSRMVQSDVVAAHAQSLRSKALWSHLPPHLCQPMGPGGPNSGAGPELLLEKTTDGPRVDLCKPCVRPELFL